MPAKAPPTPERFAEAVYRAEGLDPALRSDLYRQVLARVAAAFERAGRATL